MVLVRKRFCMIYCCLAPSSMRALAAVSVAGFTVSLLKAFVFAIMPVRSAVAVVSSMDATFQRERRSKTISAVEVAVTSTIFIWPKRSFAGLWSILMMGVLKNNSVLFSYRVPKERRSGVSKIIQRSYVKSDWA